MTDMKMKNKKWKLAKGKKCGSCGSREVQTRKRLQLWNSRQASRFASGGTRLQMRRLRIYVYRSRG